MAKGSKWTEYYTSNVFGFDEVRGLYLRGVRNFGGCSLKTSKIITLITKGPKCAHCEAKILFFASQRHLESEDMMKNQGLLHLNGWWIDTRGEAILMTRDHVLAKCKGGKGVVDNSQVLCYKCNLKKGRKTDPYISVSARL